MSADRLQFRKRTNDGTRLVPTTDADVITIGDLMLYDVTTDTVRPASTQADQLAPLANQILFVQNFVGVARTGKLADVVKQISIDFESDGQYEYPVEAATFDIGEYLTISETAAGTALENQELEKTENKALALFVCVEEKVVAAGERLFVQLVRSRINNQLGRPSLDAQVGAIEILGANRTLLLTDPTITQFDPAGARDLIMPDEALSAGVIRLVKNEADAAEDITVRDSTDSNTIVVISRDQIALLYSDATKWDGGIMPET